MEYEYCHYDEHTDSESYFLLVYDVFSEEVCSESRRSATWFILEEAYQITFPNNDVLNRNAVKEYTEIPIDSLPGEPEEEDLENHRASY